MIISDIQLTFCVLHYYWSASTAADLSSVIYIPNLHDLSDHAVLHAALETG